MVLALCHVLAHISAVGTTGKSTSKDERLVARIHPDDKAVIERAAALEGLSVTSFVVSHARSAAVRAVERHERIRLNDQQSRAFVEGLLASSAKPTVAARKAFRNYRKLVSED